MRQAFTIIEVIVTFVIMSMLIFFAIYSFRYSISNIRHAVYYLPKKTITYSLLDKTFSGIYYHVVEKNPKEFVDFFYGDSTKMIFITSSPFFSKQLSFSSLSYKDKKIIYTEDKLYTKYMNFTEPKMTSQAKEIVLFENISLCTFTYIMDNGDINKSVSEVIPIGIDINKYHLIFSIGSDYKNNKVYMYNEKYPM